MKKLLVKAEYIIQEYKAPIEGVEAVEYQAASPEVWTKSIDGEIVESSLEKPLLEDGSEDPEWEYHSATEEILAIEGVEAQPEIPELKETRIIAQTQGSDEELAQWLAGDSFKYPEGYWVEYEDISAQVEQEAINQEALAYLASTDWLIVREVETQVPCPAEIKALRAEARLKVVR